VAVLTAVIALYFGDRTSGTAESGVAANAPSPSSLSIIVLPFANQTGDSDKAYIADALTSSITSGLTRIRDAYVVPAQTAYTYKDKPLTVQQVAQDAGVRFVLSGTVQAAGAQARIAVQLMGGANAATLWTETFAGDLNDLFELQDRVTRRVANSLGRAMVAAVDRDNGKLAADAETADLLLRARAILLQNTTSEFQKQLEQTYRAVLTREPDNVAALTGLAGTLLNSAMLGFYAPKTVETQRQLVAEAENLAKRGREIAPSAYEVQDVLGWVAFYRGDFEFAERMFKAVVEAAPLRADSYNSLGSVAYAKYEPRKALEFFERATELFVGEVPDVYLANITTAYLESGDYDAAIETVEKLLAINPQFDSAFAQAAVAYSLHGEDDTAARWAAKARAANLIESDVVGFPVGSDAYERWAESVLRPTWRKLGLAE
jgi:TolB-like protein